MKGLTEQCPERPPGDFASRSDPGRRGKRKRTGIEGGGEVDRRDVISRVMNEVTDETSEKASGGDGRFATFRSVAYVPLLPSLASREPRQSQDDVMRNMFHRHHN